ncbi:MAG: hypothetical protein K2G69_02115, partial [Muribaculaceae bacterium]|nr:hypothetical protein [Muribaculaceae bacterium]
NVLTPGNLPMVCLPSDVDEGETINVLDATVNKISCNLRFLCAKVRYTILFDNTSSGFSNAEFGSADFLSFEGSSNTVSNIVSKTSFEKGNANPSDAEALSHSIKLDKISYPGSDYTGQADKDQVITKVTSWSDNAQRAWQGIVYLPENLTTEATGATSHASNRTVLNFDSKVVKLDKDEKETGGSSNPYSLPLVYGAKSTNNSPTTDKLERGKFYDLVAKAKTRAMTDLEVTVEVIDWDPVEQGHFGHTWIIVDKTSGYVTSETKDQIKYSSNTTSIVMGCDDKMSDGRPIVIESEHDVENKILTFTINPNIGIEEFGEGVGKYPSHGYTKIWVEADKHIRKYIDVEYNVEPYFEVTPLEAEIYWLENTPSDPSYTRTFSFRTNLGGIEGDGVILSGGSDTEGGSTITFSCSDMNSATGTFTVTATKDPGTSVDHYFRVLPKNDAYSAKGKDIKVTVKPPFGNYRIHFAVINDGQGDDGFKNPAEIFFSIDNARKTDLWDHNGWADYTWVDNSAAAYLYMYTQFGETEGGAIPTDQVWNFNGGWPGTQTTYDSNNKGWYYWEFSPNTSKTTSKGTKYIKPGETLLMFSSHNNGNDGGDYRRHRCPFHMDPGIQLFDFEDREGWILFDPLSNPYYLIYDEKPIIDVVEYKIYSKTVIYGWSTWYGHANANDPYKLSMTSNIVKKGDWYEMTVYAKAPRGDYSKSFQMNINNTYKIVYGGNNYYDPTNIGHAYGYYDNGTWYQGKPAGVN